MSQEKHSRLAKFGENIFGLEQMKERLPREFFDKLMFAIRNHRAISPETADVIAHAMKDWALTKEATHYTHWFQPLTGLTAEKHDSFFDLDASGRPITKFSGKQLIISEPDASSFPHGGLRSTFEARGYATWDPTSPAFLMERAGTATLCLPSVFVSYKGEVLDKKTPLIRSSAAVSKSAVRMLRLLGNKRVTAVVPNVGAEQEYFLVKEELAQKRPDLCQVGATLLGAPPSRGQQLEDHYFGSINDRVLAYMEEVENELIRLGVPVKTRHNEVAPAQFELAALHQSANVASDQNQLVMEVINRIAPRHKFKALLHEKPYAEVNGSGKHDNWSLIDSEGTNLLEPGSNKSAQMRFLVFLMAVVSGVKRHESLLSAIAANAGNDRRLGGNEAPPRITSVYLGNHLSSLLNSIANTTEDRVDKIEEIDLGLGGVALLLKDTTDRNRTSPFAFTGNKFEFRALGSSVAVSLTNVVINTMVAQSLDLMSNAVEELMETGESRANAVMTVLRKTIDESKSCCYDGDCYTDEWTIEAQKRGLKMSKHAAEALDALVDESTIEMFEAYAILTREEIAARHRIKLDLYAKTVAVELNVVTQMISTQVLPAAMKYQEDLASSLNQTLKILDEMPSITRQKEHLKRIANLNGNLLNHLTTLENDEVTLAQTKGERERGQFCAEIARPHMDAAREISDRLECLVSKELWPLPSYDDLLRIG